jgi:hypothetical protein
MPAGGCIRVSKAAAGTIRGLRLAQARSALDAIGQLKPGEGARMRIPGSERQYRAVVPPGRGMPVVIYHADGPGPALVVAVLSCREYEEYQEAERRGFLGTPAARLLLDSARERAIQDERLRVTCTSAEESS